MSCSSNKQAIHVTQTLRVCARLSRYLLHYKTRGWRQSSSQTGESKSTLKVTLLLRPGAITAGPVRINQCYGALLAGVHNSFLFQIRILLQLSLT